MIFNVNRSHIFSLDFIGGVFRDGGTQEPCSNEDDSLPPKQAH